MSTSPPPFYNTTAFTTSTCCLHNHNRTETAHLILSCLLTISGKGFDSEKATLEERSNDLAEMVTFVKTLKSYLTAMQEKSPDVEHPTIGWLTRGFSQLALVQNRPVTASPELGSTDAVKEFISRKLQAIQERVDRYSNSQLIQDINWRQFQLDCRERDRIDRVEAFSTKAQKFHAAELFNIECLTHDMFEYAFSLSPNMGSSLLSMLDSNTATSQDEMYSFEVFSSHELLPLFGLLGKHH